MKNLIIYFECELVCPVCRNVTEHKSHHVIFITTTYSESIAGVGRQQCIPCGHIWTGAVRGIDEYEGIIRAANPLVTGKWSNLILYTWVEIWQARVIERINELCGFHKPWEFNIKNIRCYESDTMREPW